MKSISSTLTEKVILLQDSMYRNETTVNRFDRICKSRASIRAIKPDIFEVIIPKLPAKFKDTSISALEWNDANYVYISPMTEHKGKFLKGKIKLWRSKSRPRQG